MRNSAPVVLLITRAPHMEANLISDLEPVHNERGPTAIATGHSGSAAFRSGGRVFSEIRLYGIPYVFLKLRIFRIVYGIALNSAELRGIPYYGICRIPRNLAEFRNFWCNGIPHNFIL